MKKNIILNILLGFALMISTSSCIESFNPDLGAADENIIVVEGNLYSDSLCVIYLNHGSGINDNINFSKTAINDATICVVGSNGEKWVGENVNEGKYTVRTGAFSPTGEYSLEITWDGATFKSAPAIPNDAPDIEEARVLQPREDKIIDILVSNVPATSNEPGYYEWSYKETWEIRSKYRTNYDFNPEKNKIERSTIDKSRGWKYGSYDDIIIANSAKYANNRIKDFRIFQISNTDQRVSVLYRCDIKMNAISRAQYDYEESRREISDNMGGLFAPMPSELNSNIKSSDSKHRAIGYVGVCGKVASYRLWIYNSDIEYTDVVNKSIKLMTDDENFMAQPDSLKYYTGYRVASEDEPNPSEQWDWTQRGGVDVTYFGATLEKPAEWPL